MNRIHSTFKKAIKKSEKVLIPFITAGHPHPLLTVPIMHSLVKNGAKIIEIGMPFSDPMADGVVIQNASQVAIEAGMTLSSVLDVVSEFRENDQVTPIILMGYLNPIEKYGYQSFVSDASKSGVDGVLIVDSPPEESQELLNLLDQYGLNQIFLITPTTVKQRQEYILNHAKGFIYCVALKGVTGAANVDHSNLERQINIIRSIKNIPIAIGFGVKDIQSAKSVAQYADAIVIGTALVEKLDRCQDQNDVEYTIAEFIQPIAKTINTNKQ